MPVTYNLIAGQTLSSSTTTITFASLPQTYTDLMIRASVRGTVTGTWNLETLLRFNGSTTNYSSTAFYGNRVAASRIYITTAAGIQPIGQISAGNNANTFSNMEIYIPSYAASQKKAVYYESASSNDLTNSFRSITAGLWSNTAAVTSISLTPSSNDFASGSSFFLYGIKNS